MGKGEMELIETVLKNDLPDFFSAFYFHKHTENTMASIFTVIDDNTTEYSAEINYTAFKGFMVKVMKSLFPDMFKKQVQKWLDNFKVFVKKKN
ncbi:SRPBCC family protein [Polaribacter cellanae]|uniref:SRPBCC family protein n=1 Tax=Polaribacter cellanae TaxID=2818493 RepID=A0A975CR25_9FLAO|nr:SRPBCC family protein [Polaribacter cellanae]QTE23785.1 SRPBCC family protein [Polaribacter cellanae]